MKRSILIAVVAVLLSAVPALADIAGNTVYYNTGAQLFAIPDVTKKVGNAFVGDNLVGNFGVGDTMTDLAFNTDRTLFGVSFSYFCSINTSTGAATVLANVPYPANALANHGLNEYYMAIDGNGQGGINGHFFNLVWNPSLKTLTSTDKGQYTDAIGTQYLSAGDIWVTSGGTVYATINNTSNNQGWLATVDPTNAKVSIVAPIPGSGPGDLYGITQTQDGTLLVYQSNTNTFYLSGNSLLDYGADTRGGTYGATAIPAPAAILLGMMGLGLVGWLKRRVG